MPKWQSATYNRLPKWHTGTLLKPQLTKLKTLNVTQFVSVEELHEYAIRVAERAMHKKGKVPFRWIVRAQDRLATFDTPWENEADKDMHSQFMRFILGATNATAYSFMTEAWIAQYGLPDEDDDKFVMPSEHPDREDVLFISTYNRSGEQRITRYGIRYSDRTRPGFGRLLARDDWRDHDRKAFEGRMFNLFRGIPDKIDEYIPIEILASHEHFAIMLRAFERVRNEMIATRGDFAAAAANVARRNVDERMDRAAAAANAKKPSPPLPEVIIVPPYVAKDGNK